MKIHQSMNALAVQMPVQHRGTLNNKMSMCARITSAFNRLIAWVQSLFKCGKSTPVITAQTTPIQTPQQNIIPPQPVPPVQQPEQPVPPVQIPVGQPVQLPGQQPVQQQPPLQPPAQVPGQQPVQQQPPLQPPAQVPGQQPVQQQPPLQPPAQVPGQQPIQQQPLAVNNVALNMTRLGAERPYDDYESPDAGIIDPARHEQIKNQIIAPILNRLYGREVAQADMRWAEFPENRFVRNFNMDLRDHVQGALWGQALGDGIGLLTEFTNREQAADMIQGRPLEFALKQDPEFLNGEKHEWRARFSDNAWTDDTDQAMALIDAHYLHNLEFARGNVRHSDRPFAESLRNWSVSQVGLQVHLFGDEAGRLIDRFNHPERDLGLTVGAVVLRPEFVANPQHAAYMVWNNNRGGAANGALMRNSPVALMYHDLQSAIDKSIRFALTTHANPLCVASCVAHTTAIYLAVANCTNFEQILEASRDVGIAYLELFLRGTRQNLDAEQLAQIEGYKNEFVRHLDVQNWQELALDGVGTGYTLKSLGAAFHALKLAIQYQREGRQLPANYTPARKVIEELVAQGGDADTNGAIAGSLLGAYFGQQALPQSWKDGLRGRDREIFELALRKIRHISQNPVPANNLLGR